MSYFGQNDDEGDDCSLGAPPPPIPGLIIDILYEARRAFERSPTVDSVTLWVTPHPVRGHIVSSETQIGVSVTVSSESRYAPHLLDVASLADQLKRHNYNYAVAE